MKVILFATLIVLSTPVFAIQKCIINGKTVYQKSCADGVAVKQTAEQEAAAAKQRKIEINAAIAEKNDKQEELRRTKTNWGR